MSNQDLTSSARNIEDQIRKKCRKNRSQEDYPVMMSRAQITVSWRIWINYINSAMSGESKGQITNPVYPA